MQSQVDFNGSISLLITGDEEGPAIDGTVKMLEYLSNRGEHWDACLVGEPTNPQVLGEMVKIGRRGSLSGKIKVTGQQGHVAYPKNAKNPIPIMLKLLHVLTAMELDKGTQYFQPSNLEITTIDVANQTGNIIPAQITAGFNIRFSANYDSKTLENLIRQRLNPMIEQHDIAFQYDIAFSGTGDAFINPPGFLAQILQQAIMEEIAITPILSTSGGTSDARFIRNYCPVIEFGLISQTAHQIDERVKLDDIKKLKKIYINLLKYFYASSRINHA